MLRRRNPPVTIKRVHDYEVILSRGEDGFIVVNCPLLKGCWSQGRTKDEALANISEAILGWLGKDDFQQQDASSP